MRRFILLLALFVGVAAAAAQVDLVFFYIGGCSQCAPMKSFLEDLASRYPELNVIAYEVGLSPRNWRLMMRLADAYGLKDVEVPVVFVGDLGVAGPDPGNQLLIEEEVQRCIAHGCPSPLEKAKAGHWIPSFSPLEAVILTLFVAWVLYVILGR